MIHFQSDRAIVLHYPRYAGGKFIGNCLSLSRHACAQHSALAQHLLTDPTDYQYKFDTVMKTLPPSDDVHSWINNYELGELDLFGPAYFEWINGVPSTDSTLIAAALSQSQIHFLLVGHPGQEANLLKIWPQATLITLINHDKFRSISKQLKSMYDDKNHCGNNCKEQYKILAGDDWPTWQEFESSGYDVRQFAQSCPSAVIEEMFEYYPKYQTHNIITFDIDNCMFDKHKFLTSMRRLYQLLGFDDFDSKLIGEFWQAYINLHVDTSQNL